MDTQTLTSELSLEDALLIAEHDDHGDVLFDYVEGLYEDGDRDLISF